MIKNQGEKRRIANEAAIKSGRTQAECVATIDAFCELVGEYLSAGREVQIRDFGTFYAKERKARPVRNPRTGETMTLPKRRVPLFRFSPEIRKKIGFDNLHV